MPFGSLAPGEVEHPLGEKEGTRLAEVDVPDLPAALSAIDAHDFTVESRACLACDVCGDDVVAFNDIRDVSKIPTKSGSSAGAISRRATRSC